MTARYSPHPGAKRSQSAYDAQRTVATKHFERTAPESLGNHSSACSCSTPKK